jgi:hypothetical protein
MKARSDAFHEPATGLTASFKAFSSLPPGQTRLRRHLYVIETLGHYARCRPENKETRHIPKEHRRAQLRLASGVLEDHAQDLQQDPHHTNRDRDADSPRDDVEQELEGVVLRPS